jgi:hypothetical protein
MGLLILSIFPSKSPSKFHQQHLTMEGPRGSGLGFIAGLWPSDWTYTSQSKVVLSLYATSGTPSDIFVLLCTWALSIVFGD